MASYNLYGTAVGSESVYEYTRRRWNELRDNFAKGKSPGVTDDRDGAFAASRLIFVEMKKNPGIVTNELPPDATYLESYINNPTNPLTWISQKAGQAAKAATHSVAVNLDKPAQWATDLGDKLPWYTKPGPLVAILAAAVILPPLFGQSLQGIVAGLKSRGKRSLRKFR